MKFYSEKNISLKNADIHLHYANNKGRGSNNVTITIVKKNTLRPALSSKYADYIKQYRCSGWKGNVTISNKIISQYGGII